MLWNLFVLKQNSNYIMRHNEDRRQDLRESEKRSRNYVSSQNFCFFLPASMQFLAFASFLSKLALKIFDAKTMQNLAQNLNNCNWRKNQTFEECDN